MFKHQCLLIVLDNCIVLYYIRHDKRFVFKHLKLSPMNDKRYDQLLYSNINVNYVKNGYRLSLISKYNNCKVELDWKSFNCKYFLINIF